MLWFTKRQRKHLNDELALGFWLRFSQPGKTKINHFQHTTMRPMMKKIDRHPHQATPIDGSHQAISIGCNMLKINWIICNLIKRDYFTFERADFSFVCRWRVNDRMRILHGLLIFDFAIIRISCVCTSHDKHKRTADICSIASKWSMHRLFKFNVLKNFIESILSSIEIFSALHDGNMLLLSKHSSALCVRFN